MPWAFKLDQLQPFQPILFWKFSTFFTSILGTQFLLPQRDNNWEKEIHPTQELDETRSFHCLGHIQTGLFAAHSMHLVLKNLYLFHLLTGEPFLITPRGPINGRGEVSELMLGLSLVCRTVLNKSDFYNKGFLGFKDSPANSLIHSPSVNNWS